MGEKTLMYDTILARSFSRYDQKKLGYGAFLGCFLIALSFCTVFKPYLGPIPVLNLRLSMDSSLKMVWLKDSANSSVQKLISRNYTSSSESEIEMVVANNHTNEEISINQDIISSNLSMPAVSSDDTTSTNSTMRNATTITSSMPQSNATISNNVTLSHNMSVPLLVNDSKVIKEIKKPICEIEGRTEICEMKGDIRVDGKTSNVVVSIASTSRNSSSASWIIRPYARKGDEEAMNRVTKWTVKSVSSSPSSTLLQCNQYHKVPGIIFSLSGYAGNNFHDYTDILVPLFLTARPFNGDVKFLITNTNPWWINKFKNVLQSLSRHELIDIDKDQHVHCFETLIVGLKRNPKELNIDPSKPPHYSMQDFRQFLRSAYSLKKKTAVTIKKIRRSPPRLLIVARKRTRAFTNTNEIASMARKLGYRVVVAEANSNVARFAEIVNNCDVMMGVHGAGLTNMVYLPDKAVLIQVVPIGGFEWLARTDFEEPSKAMNIRYLEYKIRGEESSLMEQYGANHEVLSNPWAIQKQGWNAFKSVYLEKQNVKLDVNRFRPTLLKALELLRQR